MLSSNKRSCQEMRLTTIYMADTMFIHQNLTRIVQKKKQREYKKKGIKKKTKKKKRKQKKKGE
jgi:hypothetical protein